VKEYSNAQGIQDYGGVCRRQDDGVCSALLLFLVLPLGCGREQDEHGPTVRNAEDFPQVQAVPHQLPVPVDAQW